MTSKHYITKRDDEEISVMKNNVGVLNQKLNVPLSFKGEITMYRKITRLLGLLIFFLFCLPLPSNGAGFRLVTIDFSTHGEGQFDPKFYKNDGIRFKEGTFVGFIQGDEALVGPIAGNFAPPTSSLSVRIAPAEQGTAEYTLTAFDASGVLVARNSVVIIQDTGDPETGPLGYFTLDLCHLPRKVKSFTLRNRFIRSSFPSITIIDFGVSSITFSKGK